MSDTPALYWPTSASSTKAWRKAVRSSPRYVDITAGGASMPPRRKSLPGVATAMRIRSPYWSTAATTHAITCTRVTHG